MASSSRDTSTRKGIKFISLNSSTKWKLKQWSVNPEGSIFVRDFPPRPHWHSKIGPINSLLFDPTKRGLKGAQWKILILHYSIPLYFQSIAKNPIPHPKGQHHNPLLQSIELLTNYCKSLSHPWTPFFEIISLASFKLTATPNRTLHPPAPPP